MLSRVDRRSVLQVPPEQIRGLSDRRRKLIGVPGAWLVVGRAHPDVEITTRTGRGADGAELPVRVYRPSGTAGEALPLILNFHGGGFVAGDAAQSEWWCSSIAHGVRAVVVSVDYRLAPEHRFPVAPEDCFAATCWAVEQAVDLGADVARVAVMGDSAGGNLAAVVSLMARDRGGPALAFQLLIYPGVDFVDSYASEDENEFAPILGKADLQVHGIYCPGDQANPYASPLRAEHVGLPPALILTAHHDPLRDQGAAYADALGRAGVPVERIDYPDGVHGFISIPGVVPCARRALADAVAALRSAFG